MYAFFYKLEDQFSLWFYLLSFFLALFLFWCKIGYPEGEDGGFKVGKLVG